MEAGVGRPANLLFEELTKPCEHELAWQQHEVRRSENKIEYRLYAPADPDQGGRGERCLLSALRVEDTIYISQHGDFPELVQRQTGGGMGQPMHDWLSKSGRVFVCATLRKESAGDGKQYFHAFKLYSHGCAGCDEVLMKYTCGFERATPRQWERQCLATVTHTKKTIPRTASEAHFMTIRVPALADTAAFRTVWCPRTQPADKAGHVRQPSEEEVITIESELPVWNQARGSLSLRFAEGRVKQASAKNFLVALTKPRESLQPHEPRGGEGSPRKTPASGKKGGRQAQQQRGAPAPVQRHGVLQFGKLKKQAYVLDLRHPLSLLQGFGIALTTYEWAP